MKIDNFMAFRIEIILLNSEHLDTNTEEAQDVCECVSVSLWMG